MCRRLASNKFVPLIVLIFNPYTLSASSQAAVSPEPQPYQQVNLQELYYLLQSDKPIERLLISASDIYYALNGSIKKGHVPKQLVIRNSIIKGHLSLRELVSIKINDLPPELREIYRPEDIDQVHVFSIPLAVIDSTVQGSVDFGNEWVKGDMVFNDVTIKGYVACKHSLFTGKVNFSKVIFEGDVDFANSTFPKGIIFDDVTFKRNFGFTGTSPEPPTVFDSSTFEGQADFRNANFIHGVTFKDIAFKDLVSFAGAVFQGGEYLEAVFINSIFQNSAYFGQLEILGRLSFEESTFFKDAFFNDINKGLIETEAKKSFLKFSSTEFRGRTFFDHSRLGALWCSTISIDNLSKEESEQSAHRIFKSPVTFWDLAIFEGLQSDKVSFHDAIFRDDADFSKALFFKSAEFTHTIFQKDVYFRKTDFSNLPSKGLALNGVRFKKAVNLEWQQVNNKIQADKETWEDIEDAFKRSANLKGQNEAMYERRLNEESFSDSIEFWFWGYGIRPYRLVFWIILSFLLFTLIYWTQTKQIAGKIDRIKFALGFSLGTSWKLGYGFRNSRTRLFKIITLIHSIGFKLMLLCLLKVFSNTSPLLNELVSKLVKL